MEAMASGLPAVATEAGGMAEAVADGVSGYLVPSGDVDALGARLRELVAREDLRRELGGAARRRAFELFSPARMASEYARLYARLIA